MPRRVTTLGWAGLGGLCVGLLVYGLGAAQAPQTPPPSGKTYFPVVEQDFAKVRADDLAAKPTVMQRQRTLLAERYDLGNRPAQGVMMSGGRKAVQQGVRVKLPAGLTWERLAAMAPDEIREKDLFPQGFLPLPHVNHADDRKTDVQSLGVTCLDCHSNGHTNAAFHQTPDIRPQAARFRIETVSLRGMFNQLIHGSKRSLRSVEDFTEFEQRTAYFDGDHVIAAKKGLNLPDRASQVAMMAQMQNMFDFPPAPKLTALGTLDPTRATEEERRGQELFFGKARCGTCHPAPSYLDNQMHDLKVERFYTPRTINDQWIHADGPIKTFTLRGIKDSPPYMHDGRLLTLEDTVEFFNLVLGVQLTPQEKAALVAFMRQL